MKHPASWPFKKYFKKLILILNFLIRISQQCTFIYFSPVLSYLLLLACSVLIFSYDSWMLVFFGERGSTLCPVQSLCSGGADFYPNSGQITRFMSGQQGSWAGVGSEQRLLMRLWAQGWYVLGSMFWKRETLFLAQEN